MSPSEEAKKIQEHVEALLRIMQEGYEEYSAQTAGEILRAVALRILAEQGYLQAVVPVEWWEGCSCHGSSKNEIVEGDTIYAVGQNVGEHAHAFSVEVFSDLYWKVPATLNEQEAARAAFREARNWMDRLNTLQAIEKEELARVEHAQSQVDCVKARLEREGAELNEAGLQRREAELAGLRALFEQAKHRYHQVRSQLLIHQTNRPRGE